MSRFHAVGLALFVGALLGFAPGAAFGQAGASQREREERQTRYQEVGRGEALALARREFPRKVAAPAWGLLQKGRGPEVRRYLGDAAALVDVAGERRPAVVQSTLPLRARDRSGRLAPLDLQLAERLGALEPGNALTETRIGMRAQDGLRFEGGIGVDFGGVAGGVEAQLDGDKAFYADALRSTDQIVAATPQGVEVMWQLRARRSPEALPLDFAVPDGAQLREVAAARGVTRIEVVRDGERLLTVQPPTAWDAEGQPVAVDYQLDGRRVTVRVPHRDQDVLYPLLVDPWFVVENWVSRNGDYSVNWSTDPDLDFLGWRTKTFWGGPDFQQNSGFGRGLWVGLERGVDRPWGVALAGARQRPGVQGGVRGPEHLRAGGVPAERDQARRRVLGGHHQRGPVRDPVPEHPSL